MVAATWRQKIGRALWNPSSRRLMFKGLPIITAVLGFAGAVFLLLDSGIDRVLGLLVVAGWGLLWLFPVRLVVLILNAEGWRMLLVAQAQATLIFLTWVAMVRDAINSLLPAARVGGEAAAIGLLSDRGIAGPVAVASVVVETTVTIAVQLIMTLLGLFILVSYIGDSVLVRALIIGFLVATPIILLFFLFQSRWSLFAKVEKLAGHLIGHGVAQKINGLAVDEKIRELYRGKAAIARSALWQIASLLAGAGELWVILRLLGHPGSVSAVVMLETLMQAIQSAAFLVPGALGVQEGGFVAVGFAAGLPVDVSLALSLARRIRQVGFGVPVLALWVRNRRSAVALRMGTAE